VSETIGTREANGTRVGRKERDGRRERAKEGKRERGRREQREGAVGLIDSHESGTYEFAIPNRRSYECIMYLPRIPRNSEPRVISISERATNSALAEKKKKGAIIVRARFVNKAPRETIAITHAFRERAVFFFSPPDAFRETNLTRRGRASVIASKARLSIRTRRDSISFAIRSAIAFPAPRKSVVIGAKPELDEQWRASTGVVVPRLRDRRPCLLLLLLLLAVRSFSPSLSSLLRIRVRVCVCVPRVFIGT